MEKLTTEQVQSAIDYSRLKAPDVVDASMGCVSTNQAYLWFSALRKGKGISKPVLWMLYRMAQDMIAARPADAPPVPHYPRTPEVSTAVEFIPEPEVQPVWVNPQGYAKLCAGIPKLQPQDSSFLRVGDEAFFNYKGAFYTFVYGAQRKIPFRYMNEDMIAYGDFKKASGALQFEEAEI